LAQFIERCMRIIVLLALAANLQLAGWGDPHAFVKIAAVAS
jgi:hypothetical protein